MTTIFRNMAAAIAVVVATGTTAFAQENEHKFELAADYYGECNDVTNADFAKIREDVRAFTDMEVMAETLNDPKRFFKLLSVVNNPRTIHVMASCASEPVMWETWMQNAFSMDKWASASVNLMNPEGMVNWMMAPLDAEVWGYVISQADPDRYVDWGVAFVTAEFYAPATRMLDLGWWGKRASWIVSVDSYQPILDFTGLSSLL